MVMSTMMTSLAEGMSLSDRLGLDNDSLIEVHSCSVGDNNVRWLGVAVIVTDTTAVEAAIYSNYVVYWMCGAFF